MKKISLLCIACFLFVKGFSQEPFFIDANQSLISLNPSFAGSNGMFRIQSSYINIGPAIYKNSGGRNSKLKGDLVTGVCAADFYLKAIKAGISVAYTGDNQYMNLLKTKTISIGYAQYISLVNKQLKIIPSLQIGYSNQKFDPSLVTFGSLIDPRHGLRWLTSEVIPERQNSFPDINSGLLINFKNLYLGASCFHLNQPSAGLLARERIPMRFLLHGSYNWHISNGMLIHFFAKYDKQQIMYSYQTSVTALLFKHLIIGAGYMYAKTPTATLGFRHNYFVVQASYGRMLGLNGSRNANIIDVSLGIQVMKKTGQSELNNFESGVLY